MNTYKIQQGDSLWKITRDYFKSEDLSENEIAQKVDELSVFNQISNPAEISVDFELDLSCFEEVQDEAIEKNIDDENAQTYSQENIGDENTQTTHRVQSGESLWGIVKDYFSDKNLSESEISAKVSELAECNQISNPAEISVDFELDLSCFEDKKNESYNSENQVTEELMEENVNADESKNDTDTIQIEFRQGTPEELEYETEEQQEYAQSLYDNSQQYAINDEIARTAPTLNSDGEVVANVEYYESDAEGDLSGLTIMVNSGHGGYDPDGTSFDPGAVNKSEGAEEWMINLDYAQDLAEKLLSEGADVVLTQGNYQTLEDCVNEFADEYGEEDNSNLRLVSLHCNSANENSSGIVYVNSDGNTELIDYLEEAASDLDLNIEGITQRNTAICQSANENNIENALVEIGFMSNAQELEMMLEDEEFKDGFLDSIVDGIKLSAA